MEEGGGSTFTPCMSIPRFKTQDLLGVGVGVGWEGTVSDVIRFSPHINDVIKTVLSPLWKSQRSCFPHVNDVIKSIERCNLDSVYL